jgi:hypothetical protein
MQAPKGPIFLNINMLVRCRLVKIAENERDLSAFRQIFRQKFSFLNFNIDPLILDSSERLRRIVEVLRDVTLTVGLVVSLSFWLLLYDPGNEC